MAEYNGIIYRRLILKINVMNILLVLLVLSGVLASLLWLTFQSTQPHRSKQAAYQNAGCMACHQGEAPDIAE